MTQWMAWSALFTALVALAALGFERAAAHVGVARRFVWIVAMFAGVVVPIAFALRVAPLVDVPQWLDSPATVSAAMDAPAARGSGDAMAVAQASRSWNWQALVPFGDYWVGRVWLGASVVWFALLFRAVLRLHRRRNFWREVDTDAGRVLVSNDDGPAVVGFLRPRIVIPRWALDAETETRALLLLHEREHLRANDSRVLFGAAVLLATLPWNAALWWMSRRLRLAIEIDCDARVIRASGARHAYGHLLITVGERHVSRVLPASASLTEPGTHLEARIDAMTTPRARRPFTAALFFAGAACAVLTTAAWTPRPRPFRAPQQPRLIATPVVHPATAMARVTPPVVSTPTTKSPRLEQPRMMAPSIVVPVETTITEIADPVPLRGNPAPRYPDSLRTLGLEGHVFMTFSTNAQGIPDTSTIQVIESSHELFTESTRHALPRWRYNAEGRVRFAVYFHAADVNGTIRRDTPTPVVDGVTIRFPVVVIAIVGRPRTDTLQQETPAQRQFKVWLDAFNSPDASRLDEFNRQFMRKDPVRDPTGEKGSAGMANYRSETGGLEILSIRRSQPTSLEFVARERGGDRATHVGYFAIVATDNARIESFRMLLVQPGRSVDDPALIEHLQNMRP